MCKTGSDFRRCRIRNGRLTSSAKPFVFLLISDQQLKRLFYQLLLFVVCCSRSFSQYSNGPRDAYSESITLFALYHQTSKECERKKTNRRTLNQADISNIKINTAQSQWTRDCQIPFTWLHVTLSKERFEAVATTSWNRRLITTDVSQTHINPFFYFFFSFFSLSLSKPSLSSNIIYFGYSRCITRSTDIITS